MEDPSESISLGFLIRAIEAASKADRAPYGDLKFQRDTLLSRLLRINELARQAEQLL